MKKSVIVLAIISLIVYIPSMFGTYIWDDEDFVYANTHVQEFQLQKFFTQSATSGRGKPSNYYRPIQLLSYAFEHKIGFSAQAYHISNVMWHVLAVLSMFIMLWKLRVPKWIAFASALIFAIHPVQTEAVSYISGRSDMMYVSFLCLSVILYLRRTRLSYVASMLFFLLSLLSKESALVSIAVVPILLWYYHTDRKYAFYEFQRLLPFLIILLGYLLIRLTVLEFVPSQNVWGNVAYAHNVFIRTQTYFSNWFEYIRVALFPNKLHMERDVTIAVRTGFGWWTYAFLGVQAAVFSLLFYLYRKSYHYAREALLGWGVFNVCMLFYSGIILLNGYFYEHFLYLALPFLWIFIFASLGKLKTKKVAQVMFYIYCGILIILNVQRQRDWINPIRFYTQTLRFAPRSVRIRNNLGMAYADKGEYEKAQEMYLAVIKMDPTVPHGYHNLGNLLVKEKKYKEASDYYEKALAISPNFLFTYRPLADVYIQLGEKEKLASLEAQLQDILSSQ